MASRYGPPARHPSSPSTHGQHVAVLAVERAGGEGVHQRITPAEVAGGERFQRWLRHLNARHYDIFIGMNPMTAGTRGREKADVL